MPGTNFIDKNTVITASYMNGVDQAIYDAIGDGVSPPGTPAQVRTNIGLGNVDNTSDLNKPVSTATQALIDAEVATLNTALSTEASTRATADTDETNARIAADLLLVPRDSTTGAASIPTGTTAQRPSVPAQGMLRRNSQLAQWEGYDGSTWTGIGGASGGGGNPFVYENDITVTQNYTITTNKNGMSAGPIVIQSGITVTVPSGSVWSII